MSNVAIIPARGGSKRIPNKNIRNFCGQPILKYSIDVALSSALFDEVMVSTDSDKITSLAISSGAKVPFERTQKNSGDTATLTDVLLEVIDNYKNIGKRFDFICLLLPTAPLISLRSIKTGYELLTQNHSFSSVVPVVKFSFPIQRAFRIDNRGLVTMFQPENKTIRSQDLEPAFHDSGQFYWIRTAHFLNEKSIFMQATAAMELSELEVQDIDTEDDWKLAELKYRLRFGNDEIRN
jgi:N-acylneuraminate cytidylyltransferase